MTRPDARESDDRPRVLKTPADAFDFMDTLEAKRKFEDAQQLLPTVAKLREFFRDHGWALALHGSCKRDLDFIAVPWIQRHPTVISALVRLIEDEFGRAADGPTWKPHSRIAYAFHPREWEGDRPRTWDVSFVDPRNAIERGFA